jgi:hypothetical protein
MMGSSLVGNVGGYIEYPAYANVVSSRTSTSGAA